MDNGEIYKMELDGRVLGKFGQAGKLLKEFGTVHEMDCRNPNEVFVGELTNWRVQKLTLKGNQEFTAAAQRLRGKQLRNGSLRWNVHSGSVSLARRAGRGNYRAPRGAQGPKGVSTASCCGDIMDHAGGA